MPDKKNTASNLEEFNEQARAFAVKAKQQGASNTAIKNSVMFMAQLFMDDMSRQITPYQQAQLDMQREQFDYAKQQAAKEEWKLVDTDGNGTMEWVNMGTREIKPGGSSNIGRAGEFDETGSPSVNGQPMPQPGAATTAGGAYTDGQGNYYIVDQNGNKIPVSKEDYERAMAWENAGQSGEMQGKVSDAFQSSQGSLAGKLGSLASGTASTISQEVQDKGVLGSPTLQTAASTVIDPVGTFRAFIKTPEADQIFWNPLQEAGKTGINKASQILFGKDAPQL